MAPSLRRKHARPSAAITSRIVDPCLFLGALITLIGPGYGQAPVAPPVADDRAISAGRWEVVSVEWDGKPVAPDFLKFLQVAYEPDGSWSVLFRNRVVAQGTSANDQTRSPRTFEMATLGSDGIAPLRYAGIYRLDGDSRVLCIVPDGTPRPDAFSAPRRSGRMLVTLRRVQASGVRQ
jgi:uncharacterized protein (TIGR03067 family)